MPEPALTPTSDALYDELGVTQPRDADLGWPFLVFLTGIATALGRLPLVARDTDDGPGWSIVMDVTRAPDWALPWLGQFVGVHVPVGEDPALTRSRIVAHAGFNRGTPAAMRAAAQIHLTGTQHVGILEADTSPYHLSVITLTDETDDPTLVEAAIRSQKPAGLILDYQVVDGITWDETTATWDTAPVVAWDDISTTTPGI